MFDVSRYWLEYVFGYVSIMWIGTKVIIRLRRRVDIDIYLVQNVLYDSEGVLMLILVIDIYLVIYAL